MPSDIYEKLYEFQKRDVDKVFGQSARLLGHEMGAGKTYEAVALDILHRAEGLHGPSLIIAPTGTFKQWAAYFYAWAPERPVHIIDRKNRTKSWAMFEADKNPDKIWIMHPEAVRLMPKELQSTFWLHEMFDECQKLQGRKTLITRGQKKIRWNFLTEMSGTAITTNVNGFWSPLHIMYPKQWSSYWRFYDRYIDYEVVLPQGYHKIKGPRKDTLPEFLHLIEPYYIRHLKKESCCPDHPQGVMPWLPDKTYQTIWVDLEPIQRRAYSQMKKELVAWVGQQEETPLVAGAVVAQLVRLQQFSSGYMEPTGGGFHMSEPSSKLNAMVDLLSDTDHPVVIFSHFKQFVNMAAKRFDQEGISYVTYTGDNTQRQREEAVESFRSGRVQVFLGSIKAGGVGLDGLQDAANVVFFADREWSPAENIQAEDRIWRDGQKNAVTVVDFVARDTVDLGSRQKLERKWTWIKQMLGDRTSSIQETLLKDRL